MAEAMATIRPERIEGLSSAAIHRASPTIACGANEVTAESILGLGGEAAATAAGLSAVGIDEVEALAHEGLFEVEDQTGEVDVALGIDEETDGLRAAGVVGSLDAGAEGEGAVALAGLRVETDVVGEAGTAAAGDADAETALRWQDAFFGHGDADALEGVFGDLDGLLGAGLLALGGEQRHASERVFGLKRRAWCGSGGSGLEECGRH